MELRGITVAVGQWYADMLRICLPLNMRHLAECLVVTAPGEDAVKAVVAGVPGARTFETDAFYRPGTNGVVPRFNKGLAMEEGLWELGRHDWILIHDADIVFPRAMFLDGLVRPNHLHGAKRRILDDPSKFCEDLDWRRCPLARDGSSPIGFFQLFQGDDPHLEGKRPWYDVSFPHGGGGDAFMMTHWPRNRWRVLPIQTLHLGKLDLNWWGADDEGRAMMAKYVTRNGWRRAMANFRPEDVERAGELPGRLEVEGYPPSTFELPFEARAKQASRKL